MTDVIVYRPAVTDDIWQINMDARVLIVTEEGTEVDFKTLYLYLPTGAWTKPTKKWADLTAATGYFPNMGPRLMRCSIFGRSSDIHREADIRYLAPNKKHIFLEYQD
jgi:hypothetical protein